MQSPPFSSPTFSRASYCRDSRRLWLAALSSVIISFARPKDQTLYGEDVFRRQRFTFSPSVVLVVHVFITKCDLHLCLRTCMEVFQVATRERFVFEIDSLFIPLRNFSCSAFDFDFAFRYGNVGKVCGFALRHSGARVLVTECDSFCASRAPLRRRWWPFRRSNLRPLCFFEQVTSKSTLWYTRTCCGTRRSLITPDNLITRSTSLAHRAWKAQASKIVAGVEVYFLLARVFDDVATWTTESGYHTTEFTRWFFQQSL